MTPEPTRRALPAPPTAERILDLSELLNVLASEWDALSRDLAQLETRGYGEREFRRRAELERAPDLGDEQIAELFALEAQEQRAHELPPPLSLELAGLLALVCEDAIVDLDAIRKEVEAARKLLPALTTLHALPAGGYRQVYEQRAGLYERRAEEARRRAEVDAKERMERTA